jgi:light-regulated signal transduction histidine kinase (bacteriophytochrome)
MPEQSGQETITQELEQACAEEPIHIIGTVQPHGFVAHAQAIAHQPASICSMAKHRSSDT